MEQIVNFLTDDDSEKASENEIYENLVDVMFQMDSAFGQCVFLLDKGNFNLFLNKLKKYVVVNSMNFLRAGFKIQKNDILRHLIKFIDI